MDTLAIVSATVWLAFACYKAAMVGYMMDHPAPGAARLAMGALVGLFLGSVALVVFVLLFKAVGYAVGIFGGGV